MSFEYFHSVLSFKPTDHINQKPSMPDTFLEFFQASILPVLILVFAYVTFRSCRMASPGSDTAKIRDTLFNQFSMGSILTMFQVWALVIGTYHALLAFYLFPTTSSTRSFAFHHARIPTKLSSTVKDPLRTIPSLLCPNPEHLNPKIFIWTPYTILCLIIGLVTGIARLQAYRMLGKNFTGQLAEPDRLVREGFYKYARHPGYALWAVNWWSAIALLGRVDGASACLTPTLFTFLSLPPNQHSFTIIYLNALVLGFWIWFAVFIFSKRIPEEDAMLRKTFGAQEFDAYRRETAVFCPGIW